MRVSNVKRKSLRKEIDTHVEPGSMVYSDAFKSYNDLNYDYIHNVINHAEKYVDRNVHTNGIENFCSLLKRTIGGTYVSVEPFHLFRYLDEQAFRFNRRKANDSERFFEVAFDGCRQASSVSGIDRTCSTIVTAGSLDRNAARERGANLLTAAKTPTKMVLFDVLKSSLVCQTFAYA